MENHPNRQWVAALRRILFALLLLDTVRRHRSKIKPILRILLPGRSQQPPAAKNLVGDRDMEWSWVAARLPQGGGTALDFGNGGGPLGLMAAEAGYEVTAVDLMAVKWHYTHPRLRFVQGDILTLSLPDSHFDLILNCSTVEHIGIPGRYSVTEEKSDGDLRAMARLYALLKPGGTMLLTIPVGRDAVFAPLCRVYGRERLPKLLAKFTVKEETFWVKNDANKWVISEKDTALDFPASAGSWDPLQNIYATGCFLLKKE